MPERNLAADLALLATEVDSRAKELTLSRAELAHERERRRQAELQAEELRQQLRHTRRRAKAAERELAKLSGGIDAEAHRCQVRESELQARLEQAQQVNEVLRHDLERTESERRALAANLREVLGNLRHAAQRAGRPRVVLPSATDETLVPRGPADDSW